MNAAELDAYIDTLVADWPDPTDEQLDRLAAIFRRAANRAA